MLGKPRILSLFLNSFNKFNKHKHSCKILYVDFRQSTVSCLVMASYLIAWIWVGPVLDAFSLAGSNFVRFLVVFQSLDYLDHRPVLCFTTDNL